jgi:uncharacterized protein with HEPN domain
VTVPGGRDRLRIVAMVEAIEEAKRDAAGGKESFMNPGMPQKAVLLDLIHLTESADKVSAGLKKLNPLIPWARLRELRNRGLVHDYLEADLEDLWSFVHQELPRMRRQLDRVRYPDASTS